MLGTLTHKTWVYPDQITCSCSSISKVVSVCVPNQLMYIELMKDSSIYLLDSKGVKYKLDIRDDIIDLNAYHILDRTQQSRLLLICRDLSFFYVYTDILRFYRCLSIVCSSMSSPLQNTYNGHDNANHANPTISVGFSFLYQFFCQNHETDWNDT